MQRLTEFRLRSQVDDAHVRQKMKGRIIGDGEFDILVTGPSRVYSPEGKHVLTYLPGILSDACSEYFDRLHSIRIGVNTRTTAVAAGRVAVGVRVASGPGDYFRHCRLFGSWGVGSLPTR